MKEEASVHTTIWIRNEVPVKQHLTTDEGAAFIEIGYLTRIGFMREDFKKIRGVGEAFIALADLIEGEEEPAHVPSATGPTAPGEVSGQELEEGRWA